MKTRLTRWSVLFFLLLATCSPGGEDRRELPPGVFLLARTTSVASFDRGMYMLSQALTNMGGAGARAGDLDAILRTQQQNAFLPSFGTAYLRMFTGLAGGDFSPDGGVSLAFFVNEPTGGGFHAALWLPLSNFDALVSGVAAGKHEYGNLKASKEREGLFEVTNPAFDRAKMYLKKVRGGAVYSVSLAGIDKAVELWDKSPPATLSDAGGFTATMRADFTVPGALDGLVVGLRLPVEALVGRLASESTETGVGLDLMSGLLRLVPQAKDAQASIQMAPGGELRADGEITPLPGTELARFLAAPGNRDLTPDFAAAMPGDATFIAACAGGEQAREACASVLTRLIGMAFSVNRDPLGDSLSQMAGFMLSFAKGNTALALTPRAEMTLLFTAADVETAGTFVETFNRGSRYFAADNAGEEVRVAYGTNPQPVLAALAKAASDGPGKQALRADLADLYKTMGGGGVFAMLVYPADIIKLTLTSSLRLQYDNRELSGNREMDMFTAALYGKLIEASNAAPRAVQPASLAVYGKGERLAASVRVKLRAVMESMEIYRRLVFALLPEPTRQ